MPRSPRATITASASRTMPSRFFTPLWSSIFATIRAREPRLTSSARRTSTSSRRRADADVAFVFLGERRQIDLDAGQVDMPPRPEYSRRHHAAANVRFVLLDHFHVNQAAVDEDGGADRN